MKHYSIGPDLLPFLYDIENDIGGIFAHFGYSFSPVLVSGQIADPGFYNIPTTTPVTTESVTYQAAGVPVSDTYTGTTLWNLLADAGGVTTTTAKNDILSKYVIATGSDGYKAVFSLGEIDPAFGNQPVLVAYADTEGQLGPNASDGLARMVVPGPAAAMSRIWSACRSERYRNQGQWEQAASRPRRHWAARWRIRRSSRRRHCRR
jgi:hypothetical protein